MLAAAVAGGGPTTQAAGSSWSVDAGGRGAVHCSSAGPACSPALILIILFIPIRRYSLPGNLPFELEPYRVFVAALLLGWFASLLADPRSRLRKTGFEGPLILIVGSALGSIAANPDRVAQLASIVDKKLMFFLSFVLVLYVTASTIRRLGDIDLLAKTLVVGGATVGLFAMIEARTGFNIFNHLDRAFPILRAGAEGEPEAFQKFGAAKLRVFGSAQHPIALSAAFVVLTPLARLPRAPLPPAPLARSALRCWSRAAPRPSRAPASSCWSSSRSSSSGCGRGRSRRYWPVLIPALIVIKLVLPGTLGAIKQSFLPAGGLVAEQKAQPGESGSGRIADIGPALQQWRRQAALGQGFGTRVVDATVRGPRANILDNEWLGTLLETGVLGFFGWLWFFVRVVRRFGKEAKKDDSARGWLLVSIAAGVARVRGRHVHLRRVLVHPGHVPALHLRRPRRGAARRAADAARGTGPQARVTDGLGRDV